MSNEMICSKTGQTHFVLETPNTSQPTLPAMSSTDEDDQDTSIAKRPNLRLNIDTKTHVFPEVDNFNVSRYYMKTGLTRSVNIHNKIDFSFGSHTAPVSNDTPDARRTFSFGGGKQFFFKKWFILSTRVVFRLSRGSSVSPQGDSSAHLVRRHRPLSLRPAENFLLWRRNDDSVQDQERLAETEDHLG